MIAREDMSPLLLAQVARMCKEWQDDFNQDPKALEEILLGIVSLVIEDGDPNKIFVLGYLYQKALT